VAGSHDRSRITGLGRSVCKKHPIGSRETLVGSDFRLNARSGAQDRRDDTAVKQRITTFLWFDKEAEEAAKF
jgi:hypothetical protein